MDKRLRLQLMAGLAVVVAIFSYLCIPGHPLGTFFYNVAPDRFRSSIAYLQSYDATGTQNSVSFGREVENHILITLYSVCLAFGICFPLGVIAARLRAVRAIATNLTGIARGIPGVALLFLIYPLMGQGEAPVLVALSILAAPPIFLNTVAAYAGVDPSVVEAARGMGMSKPQIFRRIQTPLAAPLVVSGLRTATVEVIASATIAAAVNFNTVGVQIFNAIEFSSSTLGENQLAVGVSTVAVMALVAELALTLVQRAVKPPSM